MQGRGKMTYKFRCEKCEKDFDIDILISEHDAEKEKQVCPDCGAKIKRVIEWTGIATAEGQGWFGKSDGSKAI